MVEALGLLLMLVAYALWERSRSRAALAARRRYESKSLGELVVEMRADAEAFALAMRKVAEITTVSSGEIYRFGRALRGVTVAEGAENLVQALPRGPSE